jgi:hypothetical protein
MFALASGPRAQPLIAITKIEIARTITTIGPLAPVFFIFALSAGFALTRDVNLPRG